MEGKKGKEKEREELCMHKTIYAKNPSFLFRLLKQKPPNASTGCYTILNTQNIIQRVLTEYTSGIFLISTLYLMSSIRYLWTLFHVGFYNSKYKADIQDSLPPPAVFLHLSSQPHRCCLCGRSSNSNIPCRRDSRHSARCWWKQARGFTSWISAFLWEITAEEAGEMESPGYEKPRGDPSQSKMSKVKTNQLYSAVKSALRTENVYFKTKKCHRNP